MAVCKFVVLTLRAIDGSRIKLGLFSIPVLLAEDLAFAGLWTLVDALVLRALRGRGERMHWLLYAVTSIYVASNVPVMRMFGTPLTFPILHAADTALADSLVVYVTGGNVLGIGTVLISALLFPFLTARLHRPRFLPTGLAFWSLAVAVVGLGFVARPWVMLRGLSRNALSALIYTTLLQRDAHGAASAIEVPPLPTLLRGHSEATDRHRPDLSSLLGAAKDRSVLWVVLESTAARYLRPYGAAEDPMPNLSELGARSLRFDSIYAAYPESIKGLFSTLCSMNPAAHTTAARYTQARLPCPSIGLRFQQAGYRTAMVHSGWFLYLGMDGIVADRGFTVAKDAQAIGGVYATSFGVDEASSVQSVLAFFDSLSQNERAFVMYLPITGHHPYHSPGPKNRSQPFLPRTELDQYRNDLHLGDEALGELLRGLRARGRMSKLLLVVSSDHGEAFHQHEGNFGHTLHLYDENLRVPLFIHLPGITDQKETAVPEPLDQPGSIMDIAPTLLDLTGLPVPSEYQGHSLLRSRSEDSVPRFLTDHTLEQVGLRHGPWKFIDESETGRAQLFDVVRDPEEQTDLSSLHPELVGRYRAHLRAWFYRQRLLITAH